MARISTCVVCAIVLAWLGARAAAQAPILHSPLLQANGPARELDVADVDGDGRPDLVVLDSTNHLSSQIGDGVGGFGAPVVQGLGAPVHAALATGDFDGDGLADAVLTRAVDSAPDQARLLLGVGDGSFAQAQFVTLTGEAGDIDVLDLDGDGDVDLLAGSADGNRLSLFRGDGTGALGPRLDVPAQISPQDVAEGDLDGDGQLDIAVSSHLVQSLAVLLANGAGGYGAPLSLDLGYSADDVQLGDVDGDGNLDAILGGDFSVAALLHGDGRGGFVDLVYQTLGNGLGHVAIGDVDEDGLQDGIFSQSGDDQVAVLLYDQPITFQTTRRFGTGDGPTDVEAADINGDGDLDLVVGDSGFYGGTITLLSGTGDGWFAGTLGGLDTAVDVAFGDLDADGRPDLVSIQTSNSISNAVAAWLNVGLGAFGVRNTAAGDNSMTGVGLADFDGDGDDDVAATSFSKKFFAYASNGDGTLTPTQTVTLPGNAADMTLGDLDGDGFADVVVTDTVFQSDAQVAILMGLGNGGFGEVQSTPTTGDQQALLVDDVNGDGNLDVILGTYAGVPRVTVLPGVGDGTLGAPVVWFSFVQQTLLASGDLDEDGDRDLVANSIANNAIVTLRNDGGSAFTATALLSTLAGTPRGLEIADFDQDGHLDVGAACIAPVSAQTGSFALFLGHGDVTLSDPLPVRLPRSPQGTALADLDGDGVLDLGVASLEDQVAVLPDVRGPWHPLGYALGGTQGLPRQIGEGTLQPGDPYTITLQDARPLSNAALVAGLNTLYAPFKGGTYVPTPQIVNYPLPTDADGRLVLAGIWPGPAAPGVDLFLQFWIQDPQGPKGWEASGAVQAALP
ncbi:MAG TPA: VCBS repeat-containing protein [Planctomycetota bacterium]|nr:VCBS repeat-containing protein [Planctomycetota bacterium]